MLSITIFAGCATKNDANATKYFCQVINKAPSDKVPQPEVVFGDKAIPEKVSVRLEGNSIIANNQSGKIWWIQVGWTKENCKANNVLKNNPKASTVEILAGGKETAVNIPSDSSLLRFTTPAD